MTVVRRRPAAEVTEDDLGAIRRLLDTAFDDFTDEDWAHAIGGWHVTAAEGDVLVAHAAVVGRSLEVDGRPVRTGYVEGVAALPGEHGRGLGSRVMTEINALVRDGFELGALSTDRHAFYGRLGWERWRGPTGVRIGGTVVRTPDEDDGIMVLRVPGGPDVDATALITCETRPGDDW